jgi:hypothetical protein
MVGIGTAGVLQRGSQAVPAARWLIFTLASRRRGRPVKRVKIMDDASDILAKARQRLADDDKVRELKLAAERERTARVAKADAAWKPVYPALRAVADGGLLEPRPLVALGKHVAQEDQLPYLEACKSNVAARIEHHLSNECDRRRATCKLFLIEAIAKAAAVQPDVDALIGLVSEAFSCLAQYNCPVWVIEEFDEIEMDVRERAFHKDVSVPARDRVAKQQEAVAAASAANVAIQNHDYLVKPQSENQLWSEFANRLDSELVAIRDLLGKTDLILAKLEIRALCERVTHQGTRIGAEPGKVLDSEWMRGVTNTGGIFMLYELGVLTQVQANDLHDVFGEMVRFLSDGTTAYKQSEIAPDISRAINRYLSERGYAAKAERIETLLNGQASSSDQPKAPNIDKVTWAISLLTTIGPNKAAIARKIGVPRTSMVGQKWARFNELYDKL